MHTVEDARLCSVVGPLCRKRFQPRAEPPILLPDARLHVLLRCSEDSAPFLQHPRSSGHSEALGRGVHSSRVGRRGEQRTDPRGLRGLTRALAIGRPGQSALSAAGPAPPGQLALTGFCTATPESPWTGRTAGSARARARLSAASGSWLGQRLSCKTRRFPR